jgi:uncharacterized zinc-type alcohol dehydrogenase-like protein
MMNQVNAYAAKSSKQALSPFTIERRDPRPNDVVIDIQFCGVCHSDIHQARDEWSNSLFPMVPGHEIVGKVRQVGANVTQFKTGDIVGVGCFIDSCRECSPCKHGIEQYCEKGMNQTYNGHDKEGKPTYGGYSRQIVVDANYVLRIPANLPMDKAAPLLCAGITSYSPMRHWNIKPGDKVAIVGLGGLGHMGVKLAAAMGAEVTVLSTSDRKKGDAIKFGATHFVNTSNPAVFTQYANHFDFMLNTAAGNIDLNQYLSLIKLDGTMVIVGVPEKPASVHPFPLIMNRRQLAGSLIGGIKETQEMLEFCSKHNITPEIEVIRMDQINEAYERMIKGEVRYRFVIDLSTL